MMSEVMRLTTFFATLSLLSLFATSIALAAAGAMNTSGIPLLCRDCSAVLTARLKPPNDQQIVTRRAVDPQFEAI